MLQYPVPITQLSIDNRLCSHDHHRLPSTRLHKDAIPPRLHLPTNLSTPPPSSPLPVKPNTNSSAHNRPPSTISTSLDDVFAPGDFVGEGGFLQGESIHLVSPSSTLPLSQQPANEFQVVRRLGTGSYAVVYLVREVLYRQLPSEDGHLSLMDSMDLDGYPDPSPSIEFGRDFAIKCLSKANLDEEALAAQMSEVTIHQSLHPHPNIVTLHRTLQTESFLLLLLEYVPGEDLFYFLEQARDHYDPDSPASNDSVSSSHTPPTPSLLSTLHPSQLLSRTRLRLISSMFTQMCDAVAACHAQQVYHRDIKPENFIVTDGWSTLPNGSQERKVIVKLTDFGLSTTERESSDMDCGSAPYMSYECRNNVAPSYRPRGADVWSLGIVLINMLYHHNPWTDTTQWTCPSFDLFRQQPVDFFMQRFAGMTLPVAEFLANKVFCVLDNPMDDSQRIAASDFGVWAKDLPAFLGVPSGSKHQRIISSSSTQAHPIATSVIPSRRPCSRQASANPAHRAISRAQSRSASRAPSLGPTYPLESSELSTVYDQELDEDADLDIDLEGLNSRSTSNNRRRKRGARKGKGSQSNPTSPTDETLFTLAVASQSLAREISEISKASRSSSRASRASSRRQPVPLDPIPVPPLPATPILPTAISSPTPTVAKKTSKWKLSFGRGSGGRASPVEDYISFESIRDSGPMSVTATNVTNLIMGLSAPSPLTAGTHRSDDSAWSRGRRRKQTPQQSPLDGRSRGVSAGHALSYPRLGADRPAARSTDRLSERAVSPASLRSGRPLASSASSMTSGNWRSSMSTTSSASTSTSAFTRFSNASLRSVSTTATSVSASSWRTTVNAPPVPALPQDMPVPKNIKLMTGVPWELNELPRQLHPNPVGDIFGSPPVRKQRIRKPKDAKLDTINERPGSNGQKTQAILQQQQRLDVATSTTDLSGTAFGKDEPESPKKVQKGQINALAKMLSALRR